MATDETRQEIEDHLAVWRDAADKVASGQSYTIDGLSLTRESSSFIKTQITNYRRQLIDLDAAELGGRQGQRVPVWN